jgi:hypothetical protein
MRRLLLLAASLAVGQPPEIHWRFGPATVALTPSLAQAVHAGWVYAQTGEMQRFLKATGNQLTGDELAVIALADLSCFAVVSHMDTSRDNAFEEYSTEADGRQVIIITRASKHGLKHEVVAQRQDEKKARQFADSLLNGLTAAPAYPWKPWAAFLILAALGFWVYRQRR